MNKLAIDGGTPVIPTGPPSWPLPGPRVAVELENACADGSWGRYHGPHNERLTKMLAEMHGSFVWPCCSGTIAVELALRGLKVQPGDEVILAGYDFSGNFRAIEAVGAKPVLVDIDPGTWCLDVGQVEAALTTSTKAVIVSHLHGGVADMRALSVLAEGHSLLIVEDACQCPGAIVQGRTAGIWGDVGVLSFGGSKLLTAGRGGALLIKSEETLQRIKIFCERGNDAFPLSELQAVVLIPQLRQLTAFNQQRRTAATRLMKSCLTCTELRPLAVAPPDCEPCYYKIPWLLDTEALGVARQDFLAAVQAEGVGMDAGFRGFTHRGARRCRRLGTLEHSTRAAEQTVLLHHPVLLAADDQLELVGAAIQKVCSGLRSRSFS